VSAAFALAALLAAAPPALGNARVTSQSAAGGLAPAVERALRATTGPLWIAYRVPVAAGRRMCCGDAWSEGACCRGCTLEGRSGFSGRREGDVPLEEGEDAGGIVYLRGDGGRVDRVRMFSATCPVDAGGRPVVWLSDVRPADSLRVLGSLVEGAGERGPKSLAEGALAAIAFHDDPAADRLLIGFARRDASSRVRGHALFWLSQKAGEKAAATITGAIEDDPDEDVKEKAVFALSQLPRDEGVPRLIEVARTNRSREVRKKAMFWLGQSNDPRALEFIEDVLTR
jgi:hypothetical protein